MRRIALAGGVAFLLHASVASAAGFLLNDQGARATGRAVAVTATVKDGSAIFYNPAGIGFADGLTVQHSGNLVTPIGGYTDTQGLFGPAGTRTETNTGTAYTGSLYATYAIKKWVRVGIGLSTPFGLRVKWPASSPGRSVVREQRLTTVFVSPVVAFNLSEWVPGLSIGGGVDLVPAAVSLKRDNILGTEIGTTRLSATAFGVGGRVGIMYHPKAIKQLSFGLAYRSKVKLDFDGKADFDAPASVRGALPPDGTGTTMIITPQSAMFGIAYRPIEALEFEFDVNWIGWSRYDQLALAVPSLGPTPTVVVSPKKWTDTLVLRLGAEYSFKNVGVDVRAGYAYDPTPVPSSTLDFSLPDRDRHLVSIGASYTPHKIVSIDAGLNWVLPGKRETTTAPIPGRYDITAVVASLGVRLSFDNIGAKSEPSEPAAVEPVAEPVEPSPVEEPGTEPEVSDEPEEEVTPAPISAPQA